MEAVILAWCQFPCLFVFFIFPYSVCLFGVFIFFGFSLVHGSCLDACSMPILSSLLFLFPCLVCLFVCLFFFYFYKFVVFLLSMEAVLIFFIQFFN